MIDLGINSPANSAELVVFADAPRALTASVSIRRLFLGVLAMLEEHDGTIRSVAWSRVFPWLSIVRVFRLSIAFRALVFGAAGLLLTATGWGLLGAVFSWDSAATEWLQPYVECPWKSVTGVVPDRPAVLDGIHRGDSSWRTIDRSVVLDTQLESDFPVAPPWSMLTRPALEGLAHTGFKEAPVRAVACLILCGLWGVAIWAFFGAAICRTAAVRLAADEQVGWGGALRYAAKKWPAYFAAPLLPVGGALLVAVPVLAIGIIMRTGTGLLLSGLLWPFVLAAGFLMTILLLGVLFGWPLMWGAISAEGTDSFDALSRSYAYLFQRPLHYLFYISVATFLGWLGWLLVENVAATVVWLGYWAAGWTGGHHHIVSIIGNGEPPSGLGAPGAVLIRFWAGCVKLLAVGYLFSYFWTASVAIYFLLRRDVDATELDEVYLDADASEPRELPGIGKDSQGAPVMEEPEASAPQGDVSDETA